MADVHGIRTFIFNNKQRNLGTTMHFCWCTRIYVQLQKWRPMPKVRQDAKDMGIGYSQITSIHNDFGSTSASCNGWNTISIVSVCEPLRVCRFPVGQHLRTGADNFSIMFKLVSIHAEQRMSVKAGVSLRRRNEILWPAKIHDMDSNGMVMQHYLLHLWLADVGESKSYEMLKWFLLRLAGANAVYGIWADKWRTNGRQPIFPSKETLQCVWHARAQSKLKPAVKSFRFPFSVCDPGGSKDRKINMFVVSVWSKRGW